MAYLSDRLQEIADMVTPGLRVADIGCDHAYLSIYLTKEQIASKVYACDINKGPVEIAKNNIKEAGLADIIDVRLCNGLSGIEEGEAESIVIAGMGGNLIVDILREGMSKAKASKELILEPQSDVSRVRHFLEDNGFLIISESMVFDEGKFYPIIKACKGKMNLKYEIYYKYGKILVHEANPILREFLILQKDQMGKILFDLDGKEKNDAIEKRIDELKNEISDCEKALNIMVGMDILEEKRELI